MILASCGGETPAQPTAGPTAAPTSAVTEPTAAATTGTEPTAAPTTGATEPTVAPTTGTGGNLPPAKNPDTLIESTIGGPETLDPAWAYDTASGEIIFNVYDNLVFMKKDKTDEFVPMLAEKYDISPDGKTYTFNIRKGVKFHDGKDLTAEDVAYSFWRGMIQDRTGGPQWILLQPFFGLDVLSFKDDVVTKQNGGDFAKGCEAAKQAITFDNNAMTVTMNLKQPYGPLLQILTGSWGSILSKAWITEHKGWDGDCANAEKFHDPQAQDSELFNQMNGTGPYKFVRWTPNQEIALDRNDNYWLQQPLWEGGPSGPAKVPHALIKFVDEWGTRFAGFQAGDADITYVDTQYVTQVDPLVAQSCDFGKDCVTANAGGSVRVFKNLPTVANTVAMFNQKVSTAAGSNRIGSGTLDGKGIPADFFSDVHIRKAFNYAFDWDTYIKEVSNGEAEQLTGPIINGVLGYNAAQAKYSLDLAKSAQEFQAATLKSADGRGVWDTGFSLQYVYNAGNNQRKTAGEILKANLAQVNPKFNIEVIEEPFAAFLEETNNGSLALFTLGWQEDFHDPHNWVFPYLSSGGAYAAQQHFAADVQKQLDDLIIQAVSSTDNDARVNLYNQIQNIAYENALDIFLVQPFARHYEQLWVQGWYRNPIYPGIYFYALNKGQ
jgi:peptide/nickel transport system substrate-binding protein